MSSELLPEKRTYSGFQRFKLAGTLIGGLVLAACIGQQESSPTPDVLAAQPTPTPTTLSPFLGPLPEGFLGQSAQQRQESQVPPEALARIPDIKIPQGLFLPGENLRPEGELPVTVIAEKGDWFLVMRLDSFYPVPKGWLITTNFGEENGILVFAKGGIELEDTYPMRFNKESDIEIQIGGMASRDKDTPEQAIARIEEQLRSLPNFSIIKKEIVDPKRGYILIEGTNDSGIKYYKLFLFSKMYMWAAGIEVIRTTTAVAHTQEWSDYYPVTRAIIANWTSTKDNITAGVVLPERLP